MQMEAEKQYQQQQPPQQNIMQLPPQPNVMQVPAQPLQQQYLMHPSGRQPFIHPGLQPITYVDPYQQHPIYMPQQAIVVQRPLEQQNTVDTNLSSDFDSRHDGLTGRETATSYNRNDSIERPPSNNDPDPWNMLPTLHAPDKQVSPKYRVEERPPESPQQQKKRVPEQRPERAGMSYEDYIAGEMGNVPATKPQESPFSATRLTSDESAPKALILSERLANLRPGTSPKPVPQVQGNSGKLARDESDAADRILLGSGDLVTKVIMSKEVETEETHHDSHEDPPQHMDRSGSLNTKPDDASLVTYGATVGSEIHTSLVLPPAEPNKEKPDAEPLLTVGHRSDQK